MGDSRRKSLLRETAKDNARVAREHDTTPRESLARLRAPCEPLSQREAIFSDEETPDASKPADGLGLIARDPCEHGSNEEKGYWRPDPVVPGHRGASGRISERRDLLRMQREGAGRGAGRHCDHGRGHRARRKRGG